MVWSRFLSWEIYLRHEDEAESGDIYRTHKLVYFFFYFPPKLTLRVWNVLVSLTYTLLSLIRLFLRIFAQTREPNGL